ncbi:glycoside hydrolase family 9 protein [Bacteroidales bacterium]|nr:glycoside hydrolase family 9 protein [Bacteroidales bacterium]
MKFIKIEIILVLLGFCLSYVTASDKIRFNSLGFTPESKKTATIIGNSSEFEIINTDNNKTVLKDKCMRMAYREYVGESGFTIDFTNITTPGTYVIKTSDGTQSESFEIKNDAYDQAFYASMRAFYLWRCGTAVEGTHNGVTFSQEKCHQEDGWMDLTEFGAKQKDGTGGWHDAGDYGKYVTNAGITVGNLFMAWDNFNEKLKSYNLDLPITAEGYPDFLQELKWETDWLLKMQYPDNSGRVFHKLTRKSFSGFIMPSEDKDKRYYAEWGTTATATFAATMAMASRYFKPYDEAYAKICLEAALKSYEFLKGHPEYKKWNQKEFSTGAYRTHDFSPRIWMAAELWETTGDDVYLKDFETKIKEYKNKVDKNWDWKDMKNLGVFTYLLSDKNGKDAKLFETIKSDAITVADEIVNSTETDLYGRPFQQYYWGCNGTVARLSVNLYVAGELTKDKKYKLAAYDIAAHLLGRNYYNRSFVTGLGINPPMKPHDRRFGADGIDAPWPGYIVGGGHSATDWVDEEKSFSHNEVAINWQAALVYIVAWIND